MRNKIIIWSLVLALSGLFSANAQTGLGKKPFKVSFYPNPATDYLMIESDKSLQGAEFILSSMIGNKLVITPEELSDNKFKISLEGMSSGYYFLIIRNKSLNKAIKFLKN